MKKGWPSFLIPLQSEKGLTLLEIIIVIAIIGFVYTVAAPNIGMNRASEIATSLGRLNEDIRSAYDLSVLTGKPCRLVFKLHTGEYWLETTDEKKVYLGNEKTTNDPTEQELEEKHAAFETQFERYTSLAKESFHHPDKDEEISTTSPVLEAKSALEGPSWHKEASLEWSKRSLGTNLGIRSIKAEHHEQAVVAEEAGEGAIAYIHFLPQGYVEQAVIFIYEKIKENQLNLDSNPYRILTKPYQGEASVESVPKNEVDMNDLTGGKTSDG